MTVQEHCGSGLGILIGQHTKRKFWTDTPDITTHD